MAKTLAARLVKIKGQFYAVGGALTVTTAKGKLKLKAAKGKDLDLVRKIYPKLVALFEDEVEVVEEIVVEEVVEETVED